MDYPADIPCKTNNCGQLVPFYFKDVLCKKCRRYYTGYRDGSYYVAVEMFGKQILKFNDDENQCYFDKFLRIYYNKNAINGKIHSHAKQYWLRKISWEYNIFDGILPAEVGELIAEKIAENSMEVFIP